ncbi:MAG: thiol reductase thioredoxin [Chlorobi bacterium]|nr:thiol reductase thioredoxin [Chlorobiota bacterium]
MKKITFLLFFVFNLFYSNSQNITTLNYDTFKQKVWDYKKNTEWKFKGQKPTIIFFYADWVNVNNDLETNLKKIQQEYGEKLNIYKVNYDKIPNIVNKLKIRVFPTLLFISSDGNYKHVTNYRNKEQIENLILNILKVEK